MSHPPSVTSQADELAAVFERMESNVRSYARAFPAIFHRGKGAELFDVKGRRFLDFFCGASALNYGHNPEPIKRQVLEYLASDGIIHALDASTSAKAAFLDAFSRTVLQPRGLDYKVQCVGPTGTDSVEAALKLARRVTGRTGAFAFTGSYHGVSTGSLSVTSSKALRRTAGVPLQNVTFVPYFEGPRGAFDTIGFLETMLEDPYSGVDVPAAIILETMQMEGGVYAAPVEGLKRLRALCDQHGIVLVVDDIQAGCGRTGAFFSFERAGIVPDLVTLSKSISGYGFPMAIVLMRRELDRWNPGEHPGTFRGHQLSFVGAAAALEYWKDPSFAKELESRGALLRDTLSSGLKEINPEIALRGLGMVWGVDMTRAGGPAAAKRVTQLCFEQGLVIERAGRGDTVIKAMPPITAPAELLREGCQILLQSVRRALA